MNQQSMSMIVETNGIPYQGIYVVMLVTLVEAAARLHKLFFVDEYKIILNANAHTLIEKLILEKIENISHLSQRKILKDEFNMKKQAAKWSLVGLITQIVDIALQSISLIGYTCWMVYYSPFTVCVYVTGVICFIKYVPSNIIEWENFNEIWKKYNSYKNNQQSDLLHMRGEFCHDNMAKCLYDLEILKGRERTLDARYSEYLNMTITLITIVNYGVVLLGAPTLSISFVIVYLQYMRLINSNLQQISGIVYQYTSAEKELGIFMQLFKDTVPDPIVVDQISIRDNILIKSSSKYNRENKLAIDILTDIKLCRGQVVYVAGLSGAGKTTFFDIISSAIKHHETDFTIYIDGKLSQHGFEAVRLKRIYLATDIRICIDRTTIFDVIVSNRTQNDARLVNLALQMACCTNFIDDEKLYKSNVDLSKGETNRIKVARYIYDILVSNPEIVLLDEIADGVDPESTVKIAEALYSYFRTNSILALVTTHLPYLQELKYDLQINIDKGSVYV